MKHGVFCIALALLMGFPQVLRAGGYLGQVSTAEAVPLGAIDVGAYVGFYEDANALFGQFRIGAVEYGEWEVKAGIADDGDDERGDDPNFMIGTAFKYHFHDKREDAAPDMAVSAMLEYYDFDGKASCWSLGGGLIGSYPFRLSNNSDLAPYGRLSLRLERNTYVGKDENRITHRDWDFDIGLNLGAQYAPSRRLQLFGELQFDDKVGLMLGVNFAIY